MNKKYRFEEKFFIVAKNSYGLKNFKGTGITMSTKIEQDYYIEILYNIADKLDLLDIYLGQQYHFRGELWKKVTNDGKLEKTTIRKVVHTVEDLLRKYISLVTRMRTSLSNIVSKYRNVKRTACAVFLFTNKI